MFVIHAPDIAAGEERRFNTAFYRAAGQPKAIWGSREPGTSAPRTHGRASTSGA